MRFTNALREMIEMSAINLGDIVIIRVTFHWQLLIFLNTPSNKRQKYRCFSTPIVHKPKDSCLIKLPRLLREFFMCIAIVGIKPVSFMSVRLSVCISTSLSGQVTVKSYIGDIGNIS